MKIVWKYIIETFTVMQIQWELGYLQKLQK